MNRFFPNWRRSGPRAVYGLLTNQPLHDRYSSSPDDPSNDKVQLEKSFQNQAHRWKRLQGLVSGPVSLFALFLSTILKLLSHLVPSYIHSLSRLLRSKLNLFKPADSLTTPPHRTLTPTSYLDGLRGVAALVVYMFHFSYLWFPSLRNGYLSTPTDTHLFQLPLLRVLHSGRSSVTIFFIISGYVLTLKTLSAIHRNQPERVLDGLAGSLFRRPFRLYLPILVSTGIAAVLVRWDSNVFVPDLAGDDVPPHANTWGEQFWHWVGVTERMVNPFQAVTGRDNLWGNDYNGHLWTIPTEFKGSLMVFMLLLAFSRSKRWVHVVGVLGAAYWQMVKGDMDQTLFCVGLLLAEAGMVMSRGWVVRGISGSVRHAVTGVLFLVGAHLMSYPESHGPSSPGFRTMSGWVPRFYQGNETRIQQFWISVGSMLFLVALMYSPPMSGLWWKRRKTESQLDMMMAAVPADHHTELRQHVDQQPLLQRLFTNVFSQYLGLVSYSLYLWHGAFNHIVGLRLLHPALAEWKAAEVGALGLDKGGFPDEASAVRATALNRYLWKWAWTFFLNTFVLFWVSDLFHRGVDAPTVRLTRRLSSWALSTE